MAMASRLTGYYCDFTFCFGIWECNKRGVPLIERVGFFYCIGALGPLLF